MQTQGQLPQLVRAEIAQRLLLLTLALVPPRFPSLEGTSRQEGTVLSVQRDLTLPCDPYCSRAAGTAARTARRKFPPVFWR